MTSSNRSIQSTSKTTTLGDRVNFRGRVYIDELLSPGADAVPLGQTAAFCSWLLSRPPATPYFFPIDLARAFIDGAIPLVERTYDIKGSIIGISQGGGIQVKSTSSVISGRPFRNHANNKLPLTVNAVGTICALLMSNILAQEPVCAITLEHTTDVSHTNNKPTGQQANALTSSLCQSLLSIS